MVEVRMEHSTKSFRSTKLIQSILLVCQPNFYNFFGERTETKNYNSNDVVDTVPSLNASQLTTRRRKECPR